MIKSLYNRPPQKALGSMTRLRAEEYSRRNAQEEAERLSVLGQASDLKSVRWIQEEAKRLNLAEEKDREKAILFLEKHKKNKLYYNEILVNLIQEFVFLEDIPQKYALKCEWDNSKVSLHVNDFASGFRSSFLPKFDLFASKMLSIKAGNTVGRLEGYVSQTESGILTPDKEEAKIVLEGFRRSHG